MKKEKVISLEDRVPKLKEMRKKKASNRLVLLLLFFFVFLVAVLYFQSSYSKVTIASISGNQQVSTEDIRLWSGISETEPFLSIRTEKFKRNLLAHKEIKSVEMKRELPNKLVIIVVENQPMAYLKSEETYFPVLENGYILQKPSSTLPTAKPILIDFAGDQVLVDMVAELNKLSEDICNRISEVHYAPTETEKNRIYMYMNDGMMVKGTLYRLAENLSYYPSIVSQLDPNIKGVIDIEVGMFFQSYDSLNQ